MKHIKISSAILGAVMAIASHSTAGVMTFDDLIGMTGRVVAGTPLTIGVPAGITCTVGGQGFDLGGGPNPGSGLATKPSPSVWWAGGTTTLIWSAPVTVSNFVAIANSWDDDNQKVEGILGGVVKWTWTRAKPYPANGTRVNVTAGTGMPIDTMKFYNKWYGYDDINVQEYINLDADGDGMNDAWEIQYFGNVSRDGTLDFDNDGSTDLNEFNKTTIPTNPDTDGDGLKDGVETGTGTYVSSTDTGTSPLLTDTDGDGLTDGAEVNTHLTNPLLMDTDNDGLADGVELANGTNPLVPQLISWFKFDDYKIVPQGSPLHLYFRCNPAATVSIDQGVGPVSMDANGNGFADVNILTNTVYTLTSYTNNGVSDVTNTASLQFSTIPVTNVGFITFLDEPTSGSVPATYWSQRVPGVDLTWAGFTRHEKSNVGQAPQTPQGPFVTSDLAGAEDASITFSTPVELERFDIFDNTDPSAGSCSVTGMLSGAVVWTWVPATNGYYVVTTGAGKSVDHVVFEGKWNHVDNFLFALPGTTWSHSPVHMTTGATSGNSTVVSWNSKASWFYNVQTAGTVNGPWTFQATVPSGGTTSSTTMTNTGAQGYRRVVTFP